MTETATKNKLSGVAFGSSPILLSSLRGMETHLSITLDYQATRLPKTGIGALLRKLPMLKSLSPFREADVQMDVDLSCVVLDRSRQVLDKVWYGNLRSQDESVRHSGDALMGALHPLDALDSQESIYVRLVDLPKEYHHLLFVASSYRKHPLTLAKRGVSKLLDSENQLVHGCDFASLPSQAHSVLMWHLERLDDDFMINTPQKTLHDFDPSQLSLSLERLTNID